MVRAGDPTPRSTAWNQRCLEVTPSTMGTKRRRPRGLHWVLFHSLDDTRLICHAFSVLRFHLAHFSLPRFASPPRPRGPRCPFTDLQAEIVPRSEYTRDPGLAFVSGSIDPDYL